MQLAPRCRQILTDRRGVISLIGLGLDFQERAVGHRDIAVLAGVHERRHRGLAGSSVDDLM